MTILFRKESRNSGYLAAAATTTVILVFLSLLHACPLSWSALLCGVLRRTNYTYRSKQLVTIDPRLGNRDSSERVSCHESWTRSVLHYLAEFLKYAYYKYKGKIRSLLCVYNTSVMCVWPRCVCIRFVSDSHLPTRKTAPILL